MSAASLPNIVVIAIDSLRADHLGCYGYGRPTSPAIDALAEESIVFDQAFAAGIPTMPSFTTLYTGLHPYRHSIVAHSGNHRLSDAILLLPQLVKGRGYVTAACDNLVVQGQSLGLTNSSPMAIGTAHCWRMEWNQAICSGGRGSSSSL